MNKGKVDVLLGLQWGDEGKGKVVDVSMILSHVSRVVRTLVIPSSFKVRSMSSAASRLVFSRVAR